MVGRRCPGWLGFLFAAAALVLLGGPESRAAPPQYRPPPVRPLIRPGLPGEGVWRAVASPIGGRPPLLVTTFRPDAANPSAVAYVVWIDHTRSQLALYPGSEQPPVAVPRGPAEIPSGQRWRLLATFNGGFKYGSHSGGGGGFAVDGHTYVPLEPGLGTIIGYRDGRVDVASWQGRPTAGADVAFARQNLHLLVNAGHPGGDLFDQAVWGWTLGGGQTVWRTGVGIDRHGNLIYAAVDDTAAGLAAALIRASAVRAIELDINPEWPTFNTYTHNHGLQPRQFVPNPQQSASRYLQPDRRDFFALYRELPNQPALVPFH